GVFRICLPDFRKAFTAYLNADTDYFNLINVLGAVDRLEPGTETMIDLINYCVYQNGEHKCLYDETKVVAILKFVGFRHATVSSFQQGVDTASEPRRKYSFYVEARK
ncbi:MAG: hypothetical protein JWM68_4438, partial [Verrucomicrobiales bacterium]|nr:hypothetical protein [Verrucomicrobiales bacterium]